MNQVAREFKISRQTAAKHLKDRGIETVRRMSEQDIAVAVEQYQAGASAMTIGKQLGFDAQTILTAMRRVGVPIRPRNGA